MLEHSHYAELRRLSSMTLTICGQGTSSAGHQYCCSQQSTLCRTRLPHGGWRKLYLVLVWEEQGQVLPLWHVSFRIKTSAARKLQNLPIGHSDRLVSLIFQIQDNKFATVISVYAPILQAEIGLKGAFYCDLQLPQRTSSHLRRLEAFYCDLQLTPRTSSHLTRLQCKSEMRFQFQNMAGNPRLTRNWQL